MKFKSSIIINRPRDTIVAIFSNSEYLKEYQEGFLRKVVVQGNEWENGTISKVYYKNGRYEMELTETIVANLLPDSLEAYYHHKHMDNSYKTSFTVIKDNQTEYGVEGEYTRINWIMPKLIAILFPNMYRKPVKRWMVNFKNFVEDYAHRNTV